MNVVFELLLYSFEPSDMFYIGIVLISHVATTRNRGGGAELTLVGEQIVKVYRRIERVAIDTTGATANRQTLSPKEGARSS